MKIKARPIAKNKSVIITSAITFFTILWNIVDAVSNLEFIAQKAGIQNEVVNFLFSPAAPKVAFFLAISALVFSLLFSVERDESEKLFYETPENDLTPTRKPFNKKETHGRTTVDAQGRTIAGIRPEELFDYFKEHTNLQANKLVEGYIGKWIEVSGSVENVSSYNDGYSHVFIKNLLDIKNPLSFYIVVAKSAEKEWVDRVQILKRGQRITVLGMIDKVNSNDLELTKCEIAD